MTNFHIKKAIIPTAAIISIIQSSKLPSQRLGVGSFEPHNKQREAVVHIEHPLRHTSQ